MSIKNLEITHLEGEFNELTQKATVFAFYETMLELFRTKHPKGSVRTETPEVVGDKYFSVRTTVLDGDGNLLSSVIGVASVDELEAQTEAAPKLAYRRSRSEALVAAGFGVPFDLRKKKETEILEQNLVKEEVPTVVEEEPVSEAPVAVEKPKRRSRKKKDEAKQPQLEEKPLEQEVVETPSAKSDVAENIGDDAVAPESEQEVAQESTAEVEETPETEEAVAPETTEVVSEEKPLAQGTLFGEDLPFGANNFKESGKPESGTVDDLNQLDTGAGEVAQDKESGDAPLILPKGVQIPEYVADLPTYQEAKETLFSAIGTDEVIYYGDFENLVGQDPRYAQRFRFALQRVSRQATYDQLKQDVNAAIVVYSNNPVVREAIDKLVLASAR